LGRSRDSAQEKLRSPPVGTRRHAGMERSVKHRESRVILIVGLSMALVGGLFGRSIQAGDDEKRASTSGPAVASEKPATDPGNSETPERWMQRIVKKFARPTSGGEKDYESEKTAFLEKYPTSPIRWRFKLLDAQRAMLGAMRGEGNKQIVALLG